MKHIKIINKLLKINVIRDLIYTSDFWINKGTATVYLVAFIASLKFVYSKMDNIVGYNYNDMYLAMLLSQLWWFLLMGFGRKSIQFVSDSINSGTIDLFFLKPYKFRLIEPFLRFDMRSIGYLPVLFILLFFALQNYPINILQILFASFFMVNG